jgi:hypothetical protein
MDLTLDGAEDRREAANWITDPSLAKETIGRLSS